MQLTPYVPPSDGKCKRGCCWTPYGCGLNRICECHPVSYSNYLKELERQKDEQYSRLVFGD